MRLFFAYYDVFPPFVDILRSFGLRHNDIGEVLPRFLLDYGNTNKTATELCFDVRYPEPNSRQNCGDTWSMRHTALYCKHERTEDRFVSILIQPPKRLQSRLSTMLSSPLPVGCRSQLVQCMVLTFTNSYWNDYIASLEGRLTQLVRYDAHSKFQKGV